MKLRTIKDLNLKEKKILLRVDLNSKIFNGKVIESDRIKAHSKTIKFLVKKKAKVVIIAHQGFPGKSYFISLKQHAKILNKYLGNSVKFVNSTIGRKAKQEISKLKPGKVILLENTRFLKDEFTPSIKNKFVKIPSWPLYYSLLAGDVKKGFEITMEKSNLYLSDARLALELLPDKFSQREFLEFLFLTVEHYNHFWYNQLQKANIWSELSSNLPK